MSRSERIPCCRTPERFFESAQLRADAEAYPVQHPEPKSRLALISVRLAHGGKGDIGPKPSEHIGGPGSCRSLDKGQSGKVRFSQAQERQASTGSESGGCDSLSGIALHPDHPALHGPSEMHGMIPGCPDGSAPPVGESQAGQLGEDLEKIRGKALKA